MSKSNMSDSQLIVSALYDYIDNARDAVESLKSAGFPTDSFGLLAYHPNGDLVREQFDESEEEIDRMIRRDAGVGAAAGGTVGALAGTLAGLAVALIPGVGPALIAGPIIGAILGTGAGAAGGGLVGALTSSGMEKRLAHRYAEGLKRGGALVVLATDNAERAKEAAAILDGHAPVNLEKRARKWREEDDWSGFEEADEELRPPTRTEEKIHEAEIKTKHYEVEARRNRVATFGAQGSWFSSTTPTPSTR